jgi:hypothetical protein
MECLLFCNRFREFCFKLRNNYLALNNRIAAYDNTGDPHCTFCRIRDPGTDIRESFNHIFFTCPTVAPLVRELKDLFEFDTVLSGAEFKQFYWTGMVEGHENKQLLYLMFWDYYRYSIYRYKVRRKIPNIVMVKNHIFFNLSTTICRRIEIRTLINNSPELARWLPALG